MSKVIFNISMFAKVKLKSKHQDYIVLVMFRIDF